MKLYDKVRLITDKFMQDGAKNGDIGYIIEIYEDGNCEVEFSDSKTGISYAQIVVEQKDLESAEND